MHRIMMVVNGRSATEQLLVPALKWRDDGYAASVFWLAHQDDARLADPLLDQGFNIMGPGAEIRRVCGETTYGKEPQKSAPPQGVRLLSDSRIADLARDVLQCVRTIRKLRGDRKELRKTLSALNLRAVVTVQERPITFLPLVAAAKDLRIPVVLVPPNYLCQPDGGAYMRRRDAGLQTTLTFGKAVRSKTAIVWVLNRVFARLMPQQVFHSREGAMLCYPGDYLLALWISGMLPPNIWHQGTRFVDRVVISGDEEALVCAEAGIPPERTAKLGNPVFEALMGKVSSRSAIRRELVEALGIPSERRILVFAVPPLWEHHMIERDEQFSMVEHVLGLLQRHDGPVVLSLHPKQDAKDYRSIASRFGAHVRKAPLMEWLVAADALVAGAYSSTVRWGVALGIPTVNLDFWSFENSTYSTNLNYPTLRNGGELSRWLDSLQSLDWRGPERLCVPAKNPLGIVIDQQFSHRLGSLIDGLVMERQTR